MRVLLVSAHPLADSYVAAVREAAVAGLRRAGHDVDVVDLDAEQFDPCLSRAEWEAHRIPLAAKPGRRADVETHAERLRTADALVLVYPTWWGGQPAILKGWLDRVWVEGVAYTLPPGAARVSPQLRHLRHLVAITTHGSPKWINVVEGEPGKRVILRQLRALCHPLVRTRWIALYGIDRSDEAERRAFLDRVEASMADLVRVTGARGRLRPAAGRRGRRSRSSRPS